MRALGCFLSLFAAQVHANIFYNLEVVNGTGSGAYQKSQFIKISALPSLGLSVFDRWEGDTEYLYDNRSNNTKVEMPAIDIQIRAIYRFLDDREPFRKKSIWLPAIIEAEDFDEGSRFVTHYDRDLTNSGNYYRYNGGVDICRAEASKFFICDTQEGEWLEYTVQVQSQGYYELDIWARHAQSSGSQISVEIDDNPIHFREQDIAQSSHFQRYTIPFFSLSSGAHRLRLNFSTNGLDGQGAEVDFMEFFSRGKNRQTFELRIKGQATRFVPHSETITIQGADDFVTWRGDVDLLDDPYQKTQTFTMPRRAVYFY